ncbi:MAG: flagellar basal body P-ring formation chaperone FlgA [Deltaproteobacteria bacterium]|jgi:flagellar basal body P-ring formation protein FlgA
MMKNSRKHLQMTGATGNRQLVQKWCGMVLLGMLVMLFSFEKDGETAGPALVTQSVGSDTVDSASIEITRNMIEDIVMDFLNAKVPWDKNRVKIKLVQISNGLMLPNMPYSYKVVPPSDTRYLGTVPLNIVFDIQGQPPKKAWATVKIEVETDVIVVNKPLNRNQTIGKDDVNVVSMDMADLPSNYISRLEDVVGKKTLRIMNPKEVFRTDIIELPPVVKRNDRVSIVAESGNLRITAVGDVKESGGMGDRVKVVNLSSNKEIFARILDSKTVRVEF